MNPIQLGDMLATNVESTAPFIYIWTSSNQDLSWRNTIASHRDLEQCTELAKQLVTSVLQAYRVCRDKVAVKVTVY